MRSPLHGLFSSVLLLITYYGRKSGKEYTLPVQYVQDGNHIYILPGYAEKKTWWRNLKGGLPVQVTLRRKNLAGNGALLDHASDKETIINGFNLYIQRFPPSAKIHNVRIEADGHPNLEDIRMASAEIQMIAVELDKDKTA